MTINSKSLATLFCFLSFFLFCPTSSLDYLTLIKKWKIQEKQDGRDLRSKFYWTNNMEHSYSTPREYFHNASSFAINQEDLVVNIKEPCDLSDDLLRQLNPSSNDTWIIDNNALDLLNNDPQALIQCTKTGDKVLFSLSGVNKFNRTLAIFHKLEFLNKTLDNHKSTDDGTGSSSFTCPDNGPFLTIKYTISKLWILSKCNFPISASSFKASNFVINNCKQSVGMGIVVIGSDAKGTFINFKFIDNGNRAFYVQSQTELTLSSSYFENNRPQIGSNGGIILGSSKTNLTIVNSSFYGTQTSFGGVIFLDKHNNITVVNTTFENNGAYFNGGALFFSNRNKITILNSTFTNNFASSGGALHINDSNSISMKNSIFEGNTACYFVNGNGGALYFGSNNEIDMENNALESNAASTFFRGKCGAMHLYENNTIAITNALFLNNEAYDDSGALCFYVNNTISIRGSIFSSNKVIEGDGGAVGLYEHNTITIIYSTFANNVANKKGGAMYFSSNNYITIVNSTLNESSVEDQGGATSFGQYNHVVIENATFAGNTATSYGGVIGFDSFCTINIRGSSFIGNRAPFGGVLYAEKNNDITISKSKFSGNNATQGGVIFANTNGSFLITESSFTKNNATMGGFLYGDEASLEIQGCECIENWSLKDGGCFYLESSHISVNRSELLLNNAKGDGGGIFATSRTSLSMTDTQFGSNSANNGGGVALIDDSILFCLFCTFENNNAVRGGGLYIVSNAKKALVAQLTYSSFQENKAMKYGGGMVVKTFGIKAFDCKDIRSSCDRIVMFAVSFENNAASLFGSIITATISDNILVSCDASYYAAFSSMTREEIKSALDNKILDEIHSGIACPSWVDKWLVDTNDGVAIGTFGHKLNLTMNSTHESKIKGDSASGFELNVKSTAKEFPTIIVYTIDAFGNNHAPLLFDNDTLELSSPDGYLRKSSVSFSEDLARIFPTIFKDVPLLNYTVDIIPINEGILESTKLKIHVYECGINEDLSKNGKLCQTCREGFYNFHPLKIEGCTTCPKGAMCNGSYIVPEERYWHKSPCHAEVKRCIVDKACQYQNRAEKLSKFTQNSTNCDMNQTRLEKYNEVQCNEGYKGRLCGSCKKSYGSSSNFECTKCSHGIVSILTLLAMIFNLLVASSLTIKGVLPLASSRYTQDEGRVPLLEPIRTSSMGATSSSQINEAIVNRNIVPQSQGLDDQSNSLNVPNQQENEVESAKGRILEAWKIKWTEVVFISLQQLQIFGASTVNRISRPLDCIVSSASHATRAIWRVLFSLLIPISVVAILSVYWGYRSVRLHANDNLYFMKRLILTVTTVAYITYFDLTQAAVRVFNCVPVHDDIKFDSTSTSSTWIVDTSIECYKTIHLVLVGIAVVVLILVSIGFPVFCSLVLFARRAEIDTTNSWTHETLGFLSGPFKERFIYWECVTMIKKASLSIIIVFSYLLGNQAQGLLILLVLVSSLYVHFICFPYEKEYSNLNYYESGALLASCFTYTLVQFFNVETCSELSRGFVSASLISINGGFVCIMLYKILKDLWFLLRAILEARNIGIHRNTNIFSLIRLYYNSRRRRAQTPYE